MALTLPMVTDDATCKVIVLPLRGGAKKEERQVSQSVYLNAYLLG